jgi:hypothetical protein
VLNQAHREDGENHVARKSDYKSGDPAWRSDANVSVLQKAIAAYSRQAHDPRLVAQRNNAGVTKFSIGNRGPRIKPQSS